ncbi:chalcone isomerase family protein [Halobacteriovorax sp. HLS]|uniref:chalcone isomerase family protein n=1 Tax=Halobacteriovorax sp. HLS TaxID=2234000 RepID=UPI000FD8AE19|nr:chalcone isomerase family protein [Halobacteriovorax sp. HLS]
MKEILLGLSLFLVSINSLSFEPKYILSGQAKYSWFFIDVYEAKLWRIEGGSLFSKPLKLELKYLRDFKGRDIAQQSVKELSSMGMSEEELKIWFPKLDMIFPNVKEGDTITAYFSPASGITFFLNSTEEIGRIDSLDFSRQFLNIWLGEKTSAQGLRNKLLGSLNE